MKNLTFLPISILLFGLFACNNSKKDTTTKDTGIDVYIDESFKPLFETSIYTFEGQNNLAKINAFYLSESDAFDAFLNGKTSTICVTRDFTDAEKKSLFATNNIEVRSTKLAIDAVALIVHPENTDTLMTIDRLKKILNGQDSVWQGTNRKINVVFDSPNSANFIYLKNLAELSSLPVNIFAVNSNEEVINHVKENRNTLGIIGVNWISDEDDPATLKFRDGITVVALAKTEGAEYFKPYQAYLYEQYHSDKGYPLVREVWMLNKAGRTSINSGLVNFMTGEKGQLIIQKSSLIPANMVARMVNIKTE
jgi:phosphate transport system substrate-binding protein